MRLILLASFLVILNNDSTAQITLDSTQLDTTLIVDGVDVPWEIQWGPDDHLWFTERYGRVSKVDPKVKDVKILLDISSQVYQQGESGLLAMVHHPDFGKEPYLYLVYTYQSGGFIYEKLVRYYYANDTLTNEEVLIDSIPGNSTHDGSRLIVMQDGKLLMSTGDAQNQASSQDLNSLNGKFLRINLDGSIPSDNPWPDSYIYSLGHRNAQGLYQATDGTIYSSEHGPTTDDEINIIEEKRNYGWPNVHGYCDQPNETQFCIDSNVVEPILAWTPTIAASDIIFYEHDAIPEWKGSLLLTALKDKKLIQMTFNSTFDSIISQTDHLTLVWGRLRDIAVAPDGSVFIATNGASWLNTDPFTHKIYQLKNNSYNPPANTVDNLNEESPISIYPNPGTSDVFISIDNSFLGAQMRITNVLGSSVMYRTVAANQLKISVNSLPAGTYFIILKDGSRQEMEKFIILR